MRASLGVLGIAIAAASCVIGAATLMVGAVRENPRLIRLGRRSIVGLMVGAVLAVVAMEWALLTHDFSIKYVAENNALATPFLFTVTGLWASLEGSILLWIVVLAGYCAYVTIRFRARANDPLVAWALVVMLVVTLFFLLLTLGPANPFQTLASVPADGRGPNPLLQEHILMAFHPPMLYLGYVGFTVPFAFAIAALITGRFGEGWLADVRRTTLIAWAFLTVGIVLGGWWSYEVLGWGGYWAWDPVENASLLPWLTGTAFLHSVMVQERRGMLRVWNLSLVLSTFCLTILGTFLTRSGVLNSVHAFAQSDIGPWLLTFLAFTVVGSLALLAWRANMLWSPGRMDSPVSREGAFLANNLAFTAFAFVVLVGTVFPLLVEALQNRQLTVGEPYFDRLTAPLGIALLFLMAVAPALPWRAATGETLRTRLAIPAWIGAAAMVVALVLGTRGVFTLMAYGLAAFTLAAIASQWFSAVRARRRAYTEGWLTAFGRTVRGNPRRYGGLVVHIGVVLIAVALATNQAYTVRREVRLAPGESAVERGYKITYLRTVTTRTDQKTKVSAQIRIEKDGRSLGVYAPAISTFPNSTQGIGTPSVRTGLFDDVYLTLVSSPSDSGPVALGFAVNPMVLWIWLGGATMVLGTGVALLPRRRERAGPRISVDESRDDSSASAAPEEVMA
ncbi:MAG: heme lyase CcmF/NrfE family subunit [Acidimicrobiia bacterium]